MSSRPSAPDSAARSSGNPSLDAWIDRASSTAVPVFSTTVVDVTSIAGSSRSSAQDLSAAIGHDAALTAKLLKIANSPLFSQPGGHARTINNAVVLLGFDAVRDLAITIGVLDQAKRANASAPLIDTLLRAFHCGAQARAIAESTVATRPEEMFLAALLSRLGELVFWASETPEAQTLAEHWSFQTCDDAAQQQALGFTLRELTAELVTRWQLRGLLGRVVTGRGKDEREAGVTLAHDISCNGNPGRWQSLSKETLTKEPEFLELVAQHAAMLQQEVSDSLQQIQEQADKVGQIARRFGVGKHLETAAKGRALEPQSAPDTTTETTLVELTDPARQVQVLAEMSQMMQGAVTLDALLQLALEGIVEGAGFDRVCFALLTPDRCALSIKHRRGEFGVLPSLLPLAQNPQLETALKHEGTLELQQSWSLHGESEWPCAQHSVLQPVLAGRTSIGLLYADRVTQGPQIAAEAIAALTMFVQHVALGLSVARNG